MISKMHELHRAKIYEPKKEIVEDNNKKEKLGI